MEDLHLEAARGWLELGNYLEANEELENITPELRAHPEVLNIRYRVYAKAEKWEGAVEIARALTKLAPDKSLPWIHLAYALHVLKRTKEAQEVLLPVVDRFPKDWLMRYNLVCYFCQLGDRKSAWSWLEKAIDLAGTSEVKLMALEDEDLKELWVDVEGI